MSASDSWADELGFLKPEAVGLRRVYDTPAQQAGGGGEMSACAAMSGTSRVTGIPRTSLPSGRAVCARLVR